MHWRDNGLHFEHHRACSLSNNFMPVFDVLTLYAFSRHVSKLRQRAAQVSAFRDCLPKLFLSNYCRRFSSSSIVGRPNERKVEWSEEADAERNTPELGNASASLNGAR